MIGSNDPIGNANCQLSAYIGAPAMSVPAGFVNVTSSTTIASYTAQVRSYVHSSINVQ